MAIVQCSCGYLKEVDNKYIGKKASCPKCQKPLIVVSGQKEKVQIIEKTVSVPESIPHQRSSPEPQCPFLNSLSVRCPHCGESFTFRESPDYHLRDGSEIMTEKPSMLKDKSLELSDKAKEIINRIDTEKAKDSLVKFLMGNNRHIYILLAVLAVLCVIPWFLEGNINSRTSSVGKGILFWSVFFVYFDATKNKIGKVPGQKSLYNNSAGLWAFGTLALWIIAFPVYLAKRKKMIEIAKEHPATVGNIRKTVILGIIGFF